MKKTLKFAVLLVVSVVLSIAMTVMANGENVEIGFCVGDATLSINGEAVTVEKPYVVGDGVTLVPVRVITEAFGAKVDWNSETKTVKLSYPEVEVSLQIGSSVAEVNGKAEQLLAAPELTENGFTMVPLRFLSETFGAEVSYDNETKKITVTKTESDGGKTVEGSVTSKYIGDSYYGWTMENPTNMTMLERSFDGNKTTFKVADQSDNFAILVLPRGEDYDFERVVMQAKNTFVSQGRAMVAFDKDTKDPKKQTAQISAKDKEIFVTWKIISTEDYVYELCGIFAVDGKDKDECMRIMSTFDIGFSGDDIHDLSTVKDGYREYKNEKLKLSFNVPESFYMTSDENAENRFSFAINDEKDTISSMNFIVYSKSDELTAKSLAERDREHNKQVMNEDMSAFGEVSEKEYNSLSACEYEYTVRHTKRGEEYTRDVFFELGNYVYNIAISVKMPMENHIEYIDGIINSIKIEEIPFDEVGVLMHDNTEATGTTKVTVGDINIDIPNDFIETSADGDTIAYIAPSGFAFTVISLDGISGMPELRKTITALESERKKDDSYTIVIPTEEKKVGNNTYYQLVSKFEDEENVTYGGEYATIISRRAYVFLVSCPEELYSEYNRQQIDKILASARKK
ncbi:MAG: copper amine oxidase N-terminal domain-containing protein [Ruminococcaceae bacterium]|nr:copper amine oxidase N-terminal domain-containing protein [Oscillospiraceae bacterium]